MKINAQIKFPKIPQDARKSYRIFMRQAAYSSIVGGKMPPIRNDLKRFVDEKIQPTTEDEIIIWIVNQRLFHRIRHGLQKHMRGKGKHQKQSR